MKERESHLLDGVSMNIGLRQFTLEDAPEIALLVGEEAVSKWTSNIPHPYSEQDAIDWLKACDSDPNKHPFAVELEGRLVACVSFWPYEPEGIEVGYWVGREYWGRGVGTAALQLMLDLPEFPGESDVYARVMLENTGSQRVLEHCGFSFLAKGGCSREGNDVPANIFVRRASGR